MLDNVLINRIIKLIVKYPWYDQVYAWHVQGYVSDQEIKDGVEYLEKLH